MPRLSKASRELDIMNAALNLRTRIFPLIFDMDLKVTSQDGVTTVYTQVV